MTVITQALISVSDKTGLHEFAAGLREMGVKILSTGGTARLLLDAGIPVTEVGDYTGFPEMLDGRVKTLHPRIHGGILGRRDLADHVEMMEKAGIPPIDLVVVNLYPFSQTVAKEGCTLEEAIENIDIGGPAMVRAAAKNFNHVAVVTDPEDYAAILREMKQSGGAVGLETRYRLCRKAFSHTAAYDGAIGNYLTSVPFEGKMQDFPEQLNLNFLKIQDLRYGENPHQNAAFYRERNPAPGTLANYAQLQGKELSYNNIGDADAAWECVKTFESPACTIVKHANPCGVAASDSVFDAYGLAFATDPASAFGGIIAFNRILDGKTAESLSKQFVEVLIAPGFTEEAKEVLGRKPHVRVLSVPLSEGSNSFDFKRIGGGLLVQSPDNFNVQASGLRVVTRKSPTPAQTEDLLFAWKVAKFVKSNAIVFASGRRTLGVGAGQMSRVDSTKIASIKALNAGLDLSGSVVASDAFFPFRDGVDVLAQAGASAVIQPGGSMRDEEVVAAANEHGIAMVFTGVRHFRH